MTALSEYVHFGDCKIVLKDVRMEGHTYVFRRKVSGSIWCKAVPNLISIDCSGKRILEERPRSGKTRLFTDEAPPKKGKIVFKFMDEKRHVLRSTMISFRVEK